jgi:phosphoribosyl 1,2-cyclic phosphodiesterase
MLIRCHGARGSIPVSGQEFLKYGGDTTCFELRTKNDVIIIVDAGSGIRRLGNRVHHEQRSEYHLIFTHSHWDHIVGFPFFKPLFHEATTIHLMGCPLAQGSIKKLLSKAMTPPFFPIPFEKLKATIKYTGECPKSFTIDSIEVFHINLSHPNLGLGFKFIEDGKTFVFLTDNELAYRHRDGETFDEYAGFAKDADLLIHDAEFTPQEYETTRTWGHSTYLDAVNLALTAKVKRLGLFHHNQNRDDTALDGIIQKCREIISSEGRELECFALTQITELQL